MDRELQEKLQKYGAGFANFLEEKYLADKTSCKGKSPAEGTTCLAVKANSELCVTSYAYPLDRKKTKAVRRETAKEEMNNLPNEEQSSNKGA